MRLYHLGYQEIREPDIHYGRKNADFGQGFYLTSDQEFAGRWAKGRNDQLPVLNTYELDLTDLTVHHFTRDADWFHYIAANRRGAVDSIGADVIIGPIANDTIYDTLGIFTSGFLKPEEALKLLLIGPEYEQIAIKSQRAADQLKWISARTIDSNENIQYQEILTAEQETYLRAIGEAMED